MASHIERRKFLATLCGAAAWPLAARAQQPEQVQRVGVLMGHAEDDPDAKARLAGFRRGLESLGWSEGRNIRLDIRFARGGAQVQVLAKELVALQPEVILANTTPLVAALRRETVAIPIVFANITDPVGSGFVASLARPGGNITGLLLFEASITGKWLAILKEVAPHLARAALVVNPQTAPYYDYFLREAQAAAASLAIEVVFSPIGDTAADIERAIEAFASVPNGGLVLPPHTTVHRDLLIALAARHRLPAVYSDRLFVVAGGLLCYSIDRIDQFRQAASYVDRILRGVKPADLPVQTPTKYETVVNLKTARTLGLTVPPGVLVAADEVIE